jgi:hypothetical protein
MMRALITISFVGLALAACHDAAPGDVAQAAERACTPPRAHWVRQASLDAGLGPPINHLSLDRNGRVYWNGRLTSMDEVSRYLSLVTTLNPEPFTFLETEMGTPCALVERVRDEMDRRLRCGDGGVCAEGIWKVWQETPTPPGTPIS